MMNRLAARLGKLTLWAGPFAGVLQLLLLGLVIFSLSRIGLVLWQWERVSATGIVGQILVQGVRADLILLGYLIVVPLVLSPLLAHNKTLGLWKNVTVAWGTFALIFIVFMEVSTPQFVMQYDVRPNRLFIEYLSYPAEVMSTLWNGFRIALVLGVGLTIVLGTAIFKLLKAASADMVAWKPLKLLALWPLLVLLVALQIRSTLAHRPANPALFALTGDAMVNSSSSTRRGRCWMRGPP
jgi:phosphoglycerol transferase MdoB-like AlkP superfamily enzyme